MTLHPSTSWKDSHGDGHTFAVADVPVERFSLPPVKLMEVVETALMTGVEALGCNAGKIVRADGHPFLAAVHASFSRHLPLVLSPDDVWLCLAQGFAHHVNANAETLRPRLVAHEGRKTITVIRDEFWKGSPNNDWPGAFSTFSDAIAQSIGKTRDLLVADFSTTGLVERAASEIVLMHAMQSFFRYQLRTRCGIPQIRLLGTVEDWRSIRRRAAVFAEYDARWWTDQLLPVLDQFVDASQGRVDRPFWNSLYKEQNNSGGPYVTGWVNTFFPYLVDPRTDAATVPNEAIQTWSAGRAAGPVMTDFPAGLARVPFMWNYVGTIFPMQLVGGFVGVAQDPDTCAVRPSIGWAVAQTGEPVPNTPENWDPNGEEFK